MRPAGLTRAGQGRDNAWMAQVSPEGLEGQVPRALAALRDADRFLYVARNTYARELQEAVEERRRGVQPIAVVAGFAAGGAIERAVHKEHEEDGVVAVQELGEALRCIKLAIASLEAHEARCGRLIAAIRGDLQRDATVPFTARVSGLQRVVRVTFDELRAGDPGQAALPVWDATDEEDREIARAAGAGIRLPHIIVGTLGVMYMIYFLVIAR